MRAFISRPDIILHIQSDETKTIITAKPGLTLRRSLPADLGLAHSRPKPQGIGRARENARRINCQANLRDLNLAVMNYAKKNNGRLPNLSSPAAIRKALGPHVKDSQSFSCSKGYQFHGNATLSGKKLSSLKNPEKLVLLYEPVNAHLGGRNVAWADGSVKWHTNENWGEILHRQKVR